MPVKRVALMGLTGALFLLAGRSFQPVLSSAAIDSTGIALPPTAVLGIDAGIAPTGDASAEAPGLTRALGELKGQHFRILVHASPEGPRYTVISPDGNVLGRGLTGEEVAREFPALQMETMTAEAPDDLGPSFPDW